MKPERMRAKCHLVRPAVGAPSHRVSYLQQRQPGRGEEVSLKFLTYSVYLTRPNLGPFCAIKWTHNAMVSHCGT